jgi:hypothetical protein
LTSDISKLLADIGVMDGFGVDARLPAISLGVSLPILHAQRFPREWGATLCRVIVPVLRTYRETW